MEERRQKKVDAKWKTDEERQKKDHEKGRQKQKTDGRRNTEE